MNYFDDSDKRIAINIEGVERKKKYNRIFNALGITPEEYGTAEAFDEALSIAEKRANPFKEKHDEQINFYKKEIEKLQLLNNELVAVNEKWDVSYNKLIESQTVLESRYNQQLKSNEVTQAVNAELTKEKEHLQALWTNAQTEIQRLKNEIKDNELAPNEFIISLSNSQRRCIIYETRQKHFVEKTAQLAKDKGTQVKAVTNDDNENIANFFWNYYYYSKKFSNGVLPIDELINAHNKYDK